MVKTKDLDPRFATVCDQIAKDLPQGTPIFDDVVCAIVEAESTGEATAVGGEGHKFGYLQIDDRFGVGLGRTARELLNPAVNASLAIPAIAEGYRQAVVKGLSGKDLLDYVWTESGRPASTRAVVEKAAGYGEDSGAAAAPAPTSPQPTAPAAPAAADPELAGRVTKLEGQLSQMGGMLGEVLNAVKELAAAKA